MSAAPYPDRLDVARRVIAGARADGIPTWAADQLRAARAHAATVVADAAALEVVGYRTAVLDHSDERAAAILAATMGCAPCWHLRRAHGPQLVVVDLNHRRAGCQRCAHTRRRPVRDDRCEVCDEPAELFVEILTTLGHMVVAGNVGACCRWIVAEAAA